MNEAKIKLTLEDKQIVSELSKVGKAFDSLAKDVKKVDKPAKDMNNALTSFGAKFLTLELAKKMATFVANTARGAKEMQGLSAETKKSAEMFTGILDDVTRTGQNIALWAMNLGGASGQMSFLANLVRETADGWAFMIGGQTSGNKETQASIDMNTITTSVTLLADAKNRLANAEKNLNTARGGEFYDAELANLAEAQKRFDDATKGMNETQVSALLAGKSINQVLDPKAMSRFSDRLKETGGAKTSPTIAPKTLDDITFDIPQKDYFEEQLKLEEDYDAEHRRIQEEKKAYDLKIAQEIAGDEVKIKQRQIDAERDLQQNRITAVNTFANGVEAALQAGDMRDKKRRLAWKATAIAEATANTAVGVTKAYAMGGPLGFITGAGITLAGLAQIATIKEQKFAKGGIVNGAESGDQVQVRANGGEMVLTKQQQANLFSMANGGAGGGATINYNPTYNVETTGAQMRRNYREFAREVKTVLSSPSFGRTQGVLA
jgi:hypothetical protein